MTSHSSLLLQSPMATVIRLPLLLLLLLWGPLTPCARGQLEEGDVSPELLDEAMREGFRIAGEQRGYEIILGLQLRGTAELDNASNQLFDFRRPEPQSKADSVCMGTSLLEVSKYLIKRLPGTTLDGVRRLQQQGLQSAACQRMLTESGSECADVRVEQVPRCDPRNPYRSLDGSCNNLVNPLWGSSKRPFTRYIRPFYEDGLDEPRGSGRPITTALPSPRKVSTLLTTGSSGRPRPVLQITSLVMQFGQFLDHDLTHTPESAVTGQGNTLLPFGCCERGVPPSITDQQRVPDCRPIDLRGDPFFDALGRSCMRFVRSLVADRGCKLGPREQLNQVTSFVDGSVLYGTSQFLSNHLRDKVQKGQLKHTVPVGSSPQQGTSCPGSFCNGALLPEQRCHAQTTASCFISGDGRANEQPGLTSLHILFMRIHNSIAAEMARMNPRWTSDTVFQETRRIVVALQQQVVYREFLPVVLGSGPMDHFNLWLLREGYFEGYNASIDPSTPNVFATAAFRFGHSLVDEVLMQGPVSNITLLNSFNQPNILKQPGTRPSQFLQSITEASTQDTDEYMVPTLTNNLFGSPSFPVGLDLYAINIMRGRDHGLAGYNEWRSACGLPRAQSFKELATFVNRDAASKFQRLYRSVDDIDLFPAALAEAPLGNGILGPTFACLIGQHFHDLRTGDRFWHENPHQPKPFTPFQLQELRSVWLSSLLCHHTSIPHMQPSPFLAPEQSRNPLRSCPSYKKLDLRPWDENFVPPPPPAKEEPTRRPPPITTKRPVHPFVTGVPQTSPKPAQPTATQGPPVIVEFPQVTAKPITITAKPPVQTSVRPLVQPAVIPTVPPPVQPPVRPPISPPVRPVVTPPTRPQVQPTVRPPISQPILPPVSPPVQPPVRPPHVTSRPLVSVRPPSTRWPPGARPSVRPPVAVGTTPAPFYPGGTSSQRPDPDRPQVHPTVPTATRPKPDIHRPQVHPTIPTATRPTPDIHRPQVHPTIPTGPIATGYPQPATSPRPTRPTQPTTEKPFIFTQPAYYPTPPPSGVWRCRGVGVWRNMRGMDRWCTINCFHPGSSYCPATHCRCV